MASPEKCPGCGAIQTFIQTHIKGIRYEYDCGLFVVRTPEGELIRIKDSCRCKDRQIAALQDENLELKALLRDTKKPHKLDEALTWRENGEMVSLQAEDFLSPQPTPYVAVLREDAEYYLHFAQTTINLGGYSPREILVIDRLKAALEVKEGE